MTEIGGIGGIDRIAKIAVPPVREVTDQRYHNPPDIKTKRRRKETERETSVDPSSTELVTYNSTGDLVKNT